MKAIAYKTPGPIDREGALQDITLEKPIAADRDLLIKIHAVSINPVDTKQRKAVAPPDGGWRALGFHAAGVVDSVGPEAKNFKPGDAVFYAGTINWPGTNAEYHLVDERIVGLTPATPSDEQAAVAQKRHHGRVHNPPGRLKALSERGDARRSALQRRLRSRRDHGCLRIASQGRAAPVRRRRGLREGTCGPLPAGSRRQGLVRRKGAEEQKEESRMI